MNEKAMTLSRSDKIWTFLKGAMFGEESPLFPTWLLAGPISLLLTNALFLFHHSHLAIFLGTGSALSLLLIHRFHRLGGVLSALVMVYPVFVQSSFSPWVNLLFFLSFILGFVIDFTTTSELKASQSTALEELNESKQQAELWHKRFETLSSQYEQLKGTLEEKETDLERQSQRFEEEKQRLGLLVEESSRDTAVIQHKNERLFDELLKLKKSEHKKTLNQELEQLLHEKLEELNFLRTKLYQLELNASEKGPSETKKTVVNKQQATGDELLLAFEEIASQALDHLLAHRKNAPSER